MRRAGGLERRSWIEPIEDFIRQYGRATPRWAILLTYELTIDNLARAVLPVLSRRGRTFRSLVLADRGALEVALTDATTRLPGAVNLHPVTCKHGGVFHPKLVFLRAGRHVRACFGSANITDGGMGTNLELWTHTESTEHLAALQSFLHEIAESEHLSLDDAGRRGIKRALCGLIRRPSPLVWSSLTGSFAERLRAGRERRANTATVISPMYASAGGIAAARSAIPGAKLRLHTTASVLVPKTTVLVYDPPHAADQQAADPEEYPSVLHAKAYLFDRNDTREALAWMGSANFTAQALTKSVQDGGNLELMIRTTLPGDEVAALEAELKFLFKARAVSELLEEDRSWTPRPALATVLACEVAGEPDRPRLIVYASIRKGEVELQNGARRISVRIQDGRGVVEGARLRMLLPDLDLTVAQVLLLEQRIGTKTVPVVVNVPHVPSQLDGGGARRTLDLWVDDLLGRVPVLPRSTSDSAYEDDHDEDAAPKDRQEIERRLDAVQHQGELDQLAVKAAMLKKLAIRSTTPGAERQSLLNEILGAVLAAGPAHVAPAIRTLFTVEVP